MLSKGLIWGSPSLVGGLVNDAPLLDREWLILRSLTAKIAAIPSHTVNMLETNGDDRGFAPEEQAEILMMAARLQEEQRDRLSADQLELLAQEAGIDPLFVRMAIERRQTGTPAPRIGKVRKGGTARRYGVMVGSFVVLQILAVVEYLVSGNPAPFPLALVLIAIWIIGMLLPKQTDKLRKALLTLCCSTAVVGLGITVLQKMTTGSVSAGWLPNLPLFLILEALAIWAGIRMESWSGAIRRLLDGDPAPTV